MSELTTLFKNTADAIRSKTGDTATMKASQFPAKIQGISVGISQDEADARYLRLSGGTMTGNLILNGNPTADNQAATKAYVDSKSGGLTKTLLWTNANPAAEFAAQEVAPTVVVDAPAFYVIIFAVQDGKNAEVSLLIDSGVAGSASEATFINGATYDQPSLYGRRVTLTTTGFAFDVGRKHELVTSRGYTNNECMIPFKIYAIK